MRPAPAEPSDHAGFHAKRTPGRLALADLTSGRRLSYAALDAEIAACAAGLARRGLAPGDRVACLARNRVETVILHLACARAGLIFVPLNWRLTTRELEALVADCEPALLVGDGQLTERGLAGLDLDRAWGDLTAPCDGGVPAADPDRASLILYTSGTSGRPKGAMLSERGLAATALNFSLLGDVDRRSVFLVDAPMFHVIGLVTSVRPALLQGGVVLVSDGFDPGRTLARLADPALAVTHYFCVPQMAAALRRHPDFGPAKLAGLTALFTGGAPHPAADIRAFLDLGVRVADGYGMSEAGTVFGMPLDAETLRAKAGSVGYAAPGVAARLVDAAGRPVGPGEAGELELKGENLFLGYWRRPDETAAAFSADGWFRSGDIALRDADGFYRIVDRRKDMFISGGENVYPAEIEAALAEHPAILECAVVGASDESWGEVGICFYAAAPDAALAADHLRAHLETRIARYKIPRRFVPLERLPRNGAGKVLKAELRARSGMP